MKKITVSMIVATSFICASAVHAQDLIAGEKVYKKVCRTCHGPKAQGMASFPKLAGQSVEYLSGRLERYRDGEKIGPNTALMAPHAKKLSNDDIVNITNYIAKTFD